MNSSSNHDSGGDHDEPVSMGKRTAGRLRSRVVVTVIAFLVAAVLAYTVYHFLLREAEGSSPQVRTALSLIAPIVG